MNKRIELLLLYEELCNKIDQDYQKVIKLPTLGEISKQITNHLQDYNREKDNLIYFYQVNNLAGKIRIDELLKGIGLHERKMLFLSTQIEEILKKENCYQCKKKLSNEPYVWFWEDEIRKWSINKAQSLGPWEKWNNNPLFFCSENCFKKSIHYQPKKTKKTKSKSPKKVKTDEQEKKQNSQGKYAYCQECYQEIKPNAKYWYNSKKNDGYELCSKKCYEEYYGEYCSSCVNKFLTLYCPNNEYPHYLLCSSCYEKEQQEKQEEEKRQTTYCQKCSSKLPEDCILNTCDNCLDKEDINGIEREREREREREQNLSEQNKLLSEISDLENNSNKTPTQKTELDAKKQKLKDLQNRQQELERLLGKKDKGNTIENKPSDKTGLYIGLGIVGVILIIGLIWLIKRKNKWKLRNK